MLILTEVGSDLSMVEQDESVMRVAVRPVRC